MIYEVENITPTDERWPKRLADLGKSEPKRLWFKGNWDTKLFEKCAAIVGSRRIVEKMVPNLITEGWIIVSGMMYGTDQVAHRMTLSCGGRTIGVLGWV